MSKNATSVLMAYNPLYKFTIQDATGAYYYATLNEDGTWTVLTDAATHYLEVLPDGWMDTEITWERDMSYMGIFRSGTNNNFKFSMDGRAIIQSIRNTQGIQGYGLVTIYKSNGFVYDLFYQCNLDFKTFHDYQQPGIVEIALLEESGTRDLHAWGDTEFNIPIWNNTGGTSWTLNDAEFVLHPGIKVRYQASYTGAASPSNLVKYYISESHQLNGWNKGAIGDGYHIVPVLNQYNIIQNNGATTFIGNDILAPFLIQGNQVPGAANFASESSFSGTNHSQPWTRNNYSLKNLLPNTPGGGYTMWASITGSFNPGFAVTEDLIYTATDLTKHPYIAFVLFEINEDDNPDIVLSRYVNPQIIYKFDLASYPNLGAPVAGQAYINNFGFPPDTHLGSVGNPSPVIIHQNKVYVIGIICDNDDGFGGSDYCSFALSDLTPYITSKWDSGASGVPIPSPSFPESVFAGMRIKNVMSKLIQYLPTTQTDGYGFPVLPSIPEFTFTSDFLDNPAINPNAPSEPIGDVIPWQILLTSGYCVHDLEGQSYITASPNKVFDYCKKQLGMGMQVIGNAFRMENLKKFLDDTVMILDLGYDVSDFEIVQEVQGVGANLKLGYTKADTNSDFGVDPFCTELYFNTPASNVPSVIDFEENGVICEMYAIEKIRAQRTAQPIGSSYDPANPSGDNSLIAIYCDNTASTTPYPIEDPSQHVISVFPIPVVQFSNAQSTDPTAGTAPYIYGMYYPDTAINIPLSPCRALKRETGSLLHSVLDLMDNDSLVFRNTSVMQFNNTVLALSGIESNIEIGAGAPVITEFKDIAINTLPSKLFLPVKCKVKSTSPINLFTIMNTNPNGYVRFFWQYESFGAKEYRFFISKVTQKPTPAGNIATEFEGNFVPTQTF